MVVVGVHLLEYYKVLGIEKSASLVEIKRAYRKMARQYHPDLNPGKNTATHFIRIKNAYDTLHDPVKRQNYDDAMCYTSPSLKSEQEEAAQGSCMADDEKIFKRKAPPVVDIESRSIQLIAFFLAEEEYALKIGDVLGIMGCAAFIPGENQNNCIEGFINVRGEELPVINLAKNFGFAGASNSEAKRIILVEIKTIKIGLIVDSVPQMVDLDREKVFDLPDTAGGGLFRFMQMGMIGERIIIILDLDRVLSPLTLAALKELTHRAD